MIVILLVWHVKMLDHNAHLVQTSFILLIIHVKYVLLLVETVQEIIKIVQVADKDYIWLVIIVRHVHLNV